MKNVEKVKFKYTDNHKFLYFNLNKRENIYHLKYLLIMVTIALYLYNFFCDTSMMQNRVNMDMDMDSNYFLSVLVLSYLIYFLIVWTIKLLLFRYVTCISSYSFEEKDLKPKLFSRSNRIKLTQKVKNIFSLMISPDSFFSKFYKDKFEEKFYRSENQLEIVNMFTKRHICNSEYYSLENDTSKPKLSTLNWSRIRIEKKFFIEWSNWLNIIFTILIILLALNAPNDILLNTCFILLIIRVFSRGIEVGKAFYKDVVTVNSKTFYKNETNEKNGIYINNFKGSLLRSQGRLSLAIHTLIEMFLLFGCLYFLYGIDIEGANEIATPLEALFYSFSVGVFNVSYSFNSFNLLNFLHVWQIGLSVILILLSIAQYLGRDEEVNEEDQDLYKGAEEIKKKPTNKKVFLIYNLSIVCSDNEKIKTRVYSNFISIRKNNHSIRLDFQDDGKCRVFYNGKISYVKFNDNQLEIKAFDL